MGKRILALDDDPDILDVYTMILEGEGYEVKTILSPDSLTNAIVTFNPDILLLDIQLGSGTNGLELCKVLKASPLTAHIPIIMVSSHESIYSAKSDYGANDIILKPFDIATLIEKVDDFLLGRVVPFRLRSA
jgi:DNA-binding response OmpR family regulator